MVDDGRIHIVPKDDGHPHVFSIECECCPTINNDGVVVHNAFDKRENLEQITGRGDGRGWSICYPMEDE
jgi:hypothetical protein